MSIDRLLAPIAWTPLALVLVVVPVVFWWLFEPAPVELRYVAPHFSDRPVASREEAAQNAVMAVRGGQEVYRYVEFCVRKPFTGTARRSWVNSAMVWHAPDVPTQLSRDVGCRNASVAVEVPTSNPSRTFMFVQRMDVQVNPIRTDTLEYPPIPLTILANK